jgi:hypothetical protein
VLAFAVKASTAKPKAATHVSSAPAKTKPARAPVATDGDDEVVVAVAPKSKKAAVATTQSAPKGTQLFCAVRTWDGI